MNKEQELIESILAEIAEIKEDVLALLADRRRLLSVNNRMRKTLETIEAWNLPETGKFWESGGRMSYGTCYGSNGERDYMRDQARNALNDTN